MFMIVLLAEEFVGFVPAVAQSVDVKSEVSSSFGIVQLAFVQRVTHSLVVLEFLI